MSRVGWTALFTYPLLLVIAISSEVPSARAQIIAVGDDTSTPIEGVGHDYIKMLSETVSPANGSASIRIQTGPAQARGITLPFAFNYDSNGVNHLYPGFGAAPISDATEISQGGWAYGLPLLQGITWSSTTPGGVSCSFNSGYTFQDPSGGRHNLGLATTTWSTGGNPNYLCSSPVTSGGDQKFAAWLLNDANGGVLEPSALVTDADGTVYHFTTPGSAQAGCSGCYSAIPDYIEDRNGNQIVFSSGGGQAIYTDTAGRAAITWDGLGGNGATNNVSVTGMNYKVNWTSATPSFSFPHEMLFTAPGYACNWQAASIAETVVNTITLPNAEVYTFLYGSNPKAPNSYGLLSEIDYPSGAWVRYTWKMSDTYSEAITFTAQGSGGSYPEGCVALVQTPVIATRSVGVAGNPNPIQTQTFVYNTVWNTNIPAWTSKTTTVVTTDTVRQLTKQEIYTYSSGNAGYNNPYNLSTWIASQVPLEKTIQYYGWGSKGSGLPGALIRTVNKTWADNLDLASQQTVLNDDSNRTSQTTYAYTGGVLSQEKTKSEYDYGLTLLRSTATTYQTFATTPVGGVIADKPSSVIVYDGNSNRFAETDYAYDSYGTGIAAVTATNHDNTNFPTTYTNRGNLTSKTAVCISCANAITTYTYDETGQVTTMTDPKSNVTNYYYADSFATGSSTCSASNGPAGNTNAFLTKVVQPPTNSVVHSECFSYDYTSGQLTGSKDQNSKLTTYAYSDPFFRPTQVNYPDGGETTLAYNDSPYNPSTPSPSVTTTKLIASGVNEISTTAFDALGHSVEAILSSDPDGTTYTATTYDGMGLPYTVSNPYRSTSDSTYGITTYSYDALGRTIQVAKPDGSTVSTGYSGTQSGGAVTTVTDETQNQRTKQTDGLGRLTTVWEAPNNSNYNYQTVYTYDPLNNLLSSSQTGGSRARTFTYDSLSRLLCAANPEVQIVTCPTSSTGTIPRGAISYTYDLNGNVATKVAPMPDQAENGTSVTTTTFSYDALNRLIEKTYANPNSALSLYSYDGTSLAGCNVAPPTISNATNLTGRMSAMCSGVSSSSWSYDPMGRTLVDSRRNKGSGAAKNYTVGYAYNEDGSLYQLTYPSGNVVTYTVGAAGHITQVSDASNSYVGYTGTPATYSPQGSLATMTNGHTGSFAGIVTSNIYNDRLQPILLSAKVGTSTVSSLCYDFHLGATINVSPCPTLNAYATGDNGNAFQVQDTYDSTRSAAFAYDPLNRLAQANTINKTSANCWGETYTIDAYGNLTNRAQAPGMAGTCYTEALNTSSTTKNHLAGLTYDAAGNVTNDGNGNIPTHDAENRIFTDAGVTYNYDAAGARIEKSSGTMYWTGSGGATLTETDLTGTINEEYIYFNGQRIARVDQPSKTVHYYFSDYLGSASVITDALGNVQERYYFYPYGGLIASIGSDPNHYKFTGKERDTESGLDNFGARYFASTMGRFMTPDWAARPTTVPYAEFGDPQSLNLYTYVRNDPVSVADADGHCPNDSGPTGGTSGGGTACGSPNNDKDKAAKQNAAQSTRTVSTTSVIGTTTDNLGNKTTVTQTTSVTFRTDKDHEGEFKSATTQTAVHSGGAAGDVIAQSGQVSISQKEAVQGMGARAFTDAQQSAMPNIASQLIRNFSWSWKDTGHTAAAVGLGALGVGCAIGEPCGVLAGIGATAGVVEGGAAVKDALDEGGH